MASHEDQESGPDLAAGIPLAAFGDNTLLQGHVGGKPVVLARVGEEVLAVGAVCTHYSGPLAQGIVVGDTIRCPWHHACLVCAPARRSARRRSIDAAWKVDRRDGKVFVTGKEQNVASARRDTTNDPQKIVVVGGGAAGFAAAEMLRRHKGVRGGGDCGRKKGFACGVRRAGHPTAHVMQRCAESSACLRPESRSPFDLPAGR